MILMVSKSTKRTSDYAKSINQNYKLIEWREWIDLYWHWLLIRWLPMFTFTFFWKEMNVRRKARAHDKQLHQLPLSKTVISSSIFSTKILFGSQKPQHFNHFYLKQKTIENEASAKHIKIWAKRISTRLSTDLLFFTCDWLMAILNYLQFEWND